MKLNLGSGERWSREGWTTLDHNSLRPFSLPSQAWDLPYRDEAFDAVFTSHMIEHISYLRIESVLTEINRVMVPGGVLRILAPDLEKLCKAYVERDRATLAGFIAESGSELRDDLGPAQMLLGFLYSFGWDNVLLNSSRSEIVGCYGHVASYDFEFLSGLLKVYGFTDIEKKDIGDSLILDHKELRSCSYDSLKEHSLVVECRKKTHVPFDIDKSLVFSGPYDVRDMMYGQRFPLTRFALAITSRIENFIHWLLRTLKQGS